MLSIYIIENLINHKVYIGSALNFRCRRNVHISKLNRKQHPNVHLQSAWNKYGVERFVFWIIETVLDKSKLIIREQFYLDLFQGYKYGLYNKCLKAGSSLGVKHSTQYCEKLSEAHKGHKHSDETRKKIGEENKGKTMSVEAKRKIGEANRGKKSRLGFKHSEETKRRMSEAKKGKPNHKQTRETRRKISEANKKRNKLYIELISNV
jgi:group I intron endonuclease